MSIGNFLLAGVLILLLVFMGPRFFNVPNTNIVRASKFFFACFGYVFDSLSSTYNSFILQIESYSVFDDR